MKNNFKLVLVLVLVITLMPMSVFAKQKTVPVQEVKSEETGVITINADFKKVDKSLSKYAFEFETKDSRYVIIKQATKMIIWTEQELKTQEEKNEFIADLKLVNKDKSLKDSYFTNPTFIFGEGENDLSSVAKQFGTYKFTVTENGVILNCDADKISHANYGTYVNKNNEEEKPPVVRKWVIETVEEDTDSATGYFDFNYPATTNGNWFLAQKINFTEKNKVILNIQAGNPKNGTSFVGKIYIDRNSDDTYSARYENNDSINNYNVDDYEVGKKITIRELVGAKAAASLDEIKYQGPGKLPAFDNGEKLYNSTVSEKGNFIVEDEAIISDEFYFAAHFNVNDVTYILVEE